MPHDHHADHDHQEHSHSHGEHVHVHSESATKTGGQRAYFGIGFLGGIAGLSFIGLSVIVWLVFGQASSLIESAPQDTGAGEVVGE